MPIIGLTDVVAPRFPSIGKLRKGDVAGAGKPGRDLEYFRFVGTTEEVQTAYEEAYGKQVYRLNVYLPHRTIEENFPTWREKWKAGGLVHRCDGQTMVLWRTPQGTFSQEPKPCPYHGLQRTAEQIKADPPCDDVGRLELILPDLWHRGFVGFVTLELHGNHDLRNLMATLMAAYAVRQDLTGIEFSLYRRMVEISTPSKDGPVRRKKSLVFLTPNPEWASLQLQAARTNQLQLPAPTVAQLEPPPIDDEEDFEEIVDHEDEKPMPQRVPEPEPIKSEVVEGKVAEVKVAAPKVAAPAVAQADPDKGKWNPQTTPMSTPLAYDNQGRVDVNGQGAWKPAQEECGKNLTDATMKTLSAMFSNGFEMTRHVEKHFGRRTLRALTWEQIAALIAWKKHSKADPRWYADKMEQGEIKYEAPTETPSMVDYAINELGAVVVEETGELVVDEPVAVAPPPVANSVKEKLAKATAAVAAQKVAMTEEMEPYRTLMATFAILPGEFDAERPFLETMALLPKPSISALAEHAFQGLERLDNRFPDLMKIAKALAKKQYKLGSEPYNEAIAELNPF